MLYSSLSKELYKEKDILFAYIFGSHSIGRTHGESDLDIALYLEPLPEDIFRRKLELIDKISEIAVLMRLIL